MTVGISQQLHDLAGVVGSHICYSYEDTCNIQVGVDFQFHF